MNREIKFRAWDKILNEFVECGGEAVMMVRGTLSKHSEIELSQYTGLKDKNSKEIYEGDIVEWKYLQTWHKNEVRWVGGDFVVTTSGFKDDLNEPQNLSLVSILNCEIIGNIYENSDLLK